MLRATVAELVKQELEKKLLSASGRQVRAEQECLRQIIDLNPNMILSKNRQVNTFLSIKLLRLLRNNN